MSKKPKKTQVVTHEEVIEELGEKVEKEEEKIVREDLDIPTKESKRDVEVKEYLKSEIDNIFSFVSNRYTRVKPSGKFKGTLYRYQEESLGWMLTREQWRKEKGGPSPTIRDVAEQWTMKGNIMISKKEGGLTVENLHYSLNEVGEGGSREGGEGGREGGGSTTSNQQQPPQLIPIQASTKGGILADEMGLGKTIQMLALIATNLKPHGRNGTLVVVPLSLMSQWESEALKMVPDIRIYILHSSRVPSIGKVNFDELRHYDIVITVYQTLTGLMKRPQFSQLKWWRVILDEAHEIRNATTGEAKMAKACFLLEAEHRWALTGTPVQNRWRDLYPLFHFLRVRPYGEFEGWLKFIEYPLDKKRGYEGLQAGAEITLRNLISRLVMRRTKNQTLDHPVLEEGAMVKLYDDQDGIVVSKVLTLEFDNMEAGPIKPLPGEEDLAYFPRYNDQFEILNTLIHIPPKTIRFIGFDLPDPKAYYGVELPRSYLLLLRLRQLSIDPLIYDKDKKGGGKDLQLLKIENEQVGEEMEETRKTKEAEKTNKVDKKSRLDSYCEKIVKPSPKFEYLATQLFTLAKTQPTVKSIVFSYFTSVLDLLEVVLEGYGWVNAKFPQGQCPRFRSIPKNGLKYVRIDGTISPDERADIVRLFESDGDNSVKLIMMSLKAGGVGLNLSRASNVYFMEPFFNPGAMNQAIDRVHRIGQVRPVNVEILISRESVEEKIVGLLNYKTRVAAASLADFVKPGKELLTTILGEKDKVDIREIADSSVIYERGTSAPL
jgi:SNF2 family DNA or RNA helicase